MRQVTLDWETYQKEMRDGSVHYDEGFEAGTLASDKRLLPVLNFIRDALSDARRVDPNQLKELMKEAGEL